MKNVRELFLHYFIEMFVILNNGGVLILYLLIYFFFGNLKLLTKENMKNIIKSNKTIFMVA